MTFNLDSIHFAGSQWDPIRQMCIYTGHRGGQHWTVEIPLAALHQHGGNKIGRRRTVESAIETAMAGPSDEEKMAASVKMLEEASL